MSRLTVAAAQIACRPGDMQANLARHLDAIETAQLRGVDLLVFPELSLPDYLAAPDCAVLALGRDEALLRLLAGVAGSMAVSVGFIERDEAGRFFNAQALLRHGKVMAVHRKLNLPGYGALREDAVYAAGEALGLAPLGEDGAEGDPAGDSWQAATLICADSWNPALPWLAALAGATLLILPVASSRDAVDGGFDNPRGWELNLGHTAMSYGLPTIFANHCGKRGGGHGSEAGGFDFWGGSRILDASGRVLAQAGEEPCLISAVLEPVTAAPPAPTCRRSATATRR